MNNNLLEFGGTGDLIATAICDFELNGIFFKQGDIILNLENVGVHFHYNNASSNIASKRNQIYYNEYYLDSFSINVAPFNFQTQKLFSETTQDTFAIIEHERLIAMSGKLLLLGTPSDTTSIKIAGIENFTATTVNGVVVLDSMDLKNENEYDVYYYREIKSNVLNLDNADLDIPYLKIQIVFRGNSDKQNSINYFIVDKAAVRLTPVFNLIDNSVSYIQLFFKVIDSDKKPKLSVMTNGE